MDVQYAFEKLYTAVNALILQDMSLAERVATGWVRNGPQAIKLDDVPEHMREALHALQERLAALCPRKSERSETATALTGTEAAAIASQLLELFIEVTLLLPKPNKEE